MRAPLLLAAMMAAFSTQALADAPLSSTLTQQGACFSRTYDAAHLAAHPRQTVRRFFVGVAGEEWRATATAGYFNIAFGFQITGHADTYTGIGICAPQGARLACDIESDGGSFTITRNGDGLRIDAARIEVEGEHDFSPDLAAGDNRIMLLRPAASSACAG